MGECRPGDAPDGIEPTQPLLALGIAIGAVSTSAILVRWSQAPSLVKAFYRVLFTIVLVGPFAIYRHRTALDRLSQRDLIGAGRDGHLAWLAGTVVAGIALALHFASWFESLNHTSVAASVTLVQSQPLFVAVGAFLFLDERITRRIAVGIAIAMAGMVVMSAAGIGTLGSLFGNALAVVGAVMASIYVLSGRYLRQRIALLPYVTVVYLVCAGVLFVFVLASDLPLVAYPLREWLLFLGMAIGPGLFGHTLINWALAHLESSVVSVSLLGEPVGSSLLALILLSEIPELLSVIGGAIVLTGIVITARR